MSLLNSGLLLLAMSTAFARHDDQVDMYITSSENGIGECSIVARPDGPHLLIKIVTEDNGDALELQSDDFDGRLYPILGYHTSGRLKGRPYWHDPSLAHPKKLDFPIHSTKALLEGRKVVRLFPKPGKYVLRVGYTFLNASEESNTGGLCEINYTGD